MPAISQFAFPDLGPAAPPDGPGAAGLFLRARGAWYGLQRYVAETLALPGGQTDLLPAAVPGLGADAAIYLAAIQPTYAALHGCCRNWRDQTFPASVRLADAIDGFAKKAANYYGALGDLLEQLCRPAADDSAELRAEVREIVDELRADVAQHARQAAQVWEAIAIVRDGASAAAADLGLAHAALDRAFDGLDGRVQLIALALDRLRGEIDRLNRDYEHNVLAAATAPSYVWAPPIGLIAAGIAAGGYSEGAASLGRRLDAALAGAAALDCADQAALRLIMLAGLAESRLNGILALSERALAAVAAIEAVWHAQDAALAAFDEDIEAIDADCAAEVRRFCLRLGAAIDQWRALGYAADLYRANAFIDLPQELAI